MQAAALTRAARTWIGVPYRDQGRARSGADCWGFVVGMLDELALLPSGVPRSAFTRTQSAQLTVELAKLCTRVHLASEGRLLAVRHRLGAPATHLAYCAGGSIIHCPVHPGYVLEQAYAPAWRRLTDSAWLIPGIDP